MNNNYNYFNPNLGTRNIQVPPLRAFTPSIPVSPAPLPKLSSLLGGSKALGATTATASKVTFSGILNGASKTLGVINQAIPVFYQVKPIWNNARTMFRVVKELNSNDKTNTSNNTNNSTTNTTTENTEKKGNNSPTFFA